MERQATIYFNFMDFDSLDRETPWRLLGHYGLPSKIINLIKNMYQDFNGQVICKLSDTLAITTGVWEGCCHWLDHEENNRKPGIQWRLQTADNLALVYENHTHMQQKTDGLQDSNEQRGLKINTGKTKTMRINPKIIDPIIHREGGHRGRGAFHLLREQHQQGRRSRQGHRATHW